MAYFKLFISLILTGVLSACTPFFDRDAMVPQPDGDGDSDGDGDDDSDGETPHDERDIDGDGYLACRDDCNDLNPLIHLCDCLAIGRWDGATLIYRNEGGSLSHVWTSEEIEPTSRVAWGDWNGDNRLDLATANGGPDSSGEYGPAPIRIYQNTGTEFLPAWPSGSNPFPNGFYKDVEWGDMDGDGDFDLAVAGEDWPGVWVYRNTLHELDEPDFSNFWPEEDRDGKSWDIDWGDWDNDGDLDLARASHRTVANFVYEFISGVPDRFVEAWTDNYTEDEAHTYSVSWGDMDNDGFLDLALGNSLGLGCQVYRNIPNRIPGDRFARDLELVWTGNDSEVLRIEWWYWDDDDFLDLVAVGRDTNAFYHYVASDGGRSFESFELATGHEYRDIAVGDWDGDHDLDLVVAGDETIFYRNNGGIPAPELLLGAGFESTSVAWGDCWAGY